MNIHAPSQDLIRDAWDAIAPRFDEFVTPESMQYGAHALRQLHIGRGTRFLDVACGSGALSLPAARLGADVVAVDISQAMTERVAARARAQGLSNIWCRVMNGQDLDLADDTFDIAASQHGVSLFPDVDAGLAEMVRVTKRGGTVLVIAFGALPKAEFLAFFVAAIKAAVPGFAIPPLDPPPLPFQLADRELFRSKLIAAGLNDVTVERTAWEMPFRSGAHMCTMVTSSNPLGAQLVAGLTAAQRADVEHVLDGILRERSGGQPGAVLYADVNVGVGTK
ncbi:class I SAM-dependent methyltransferase [Mycolicibacterium monacense]|uniref:Methyltransferase type 11 domain-containing protein n=1 Tax=Mycolicibacterium monacense TaxID=85693 RepID=A0AAD1IZG2_MYCMB|nr:methyltransferase domain-containing protein [Mycolicibacterium monacense]MDA4099967.1 SAM-dependent methlyltransferase [Mycolicibacterium monacense DSM 44395]ORB11945.1 SAM-dependent methyltransferase [Mycolicibacterium monacense DSM 44395]QHP84272.1 methyltransferase domain-containing protein [Mycolicibacterium monacense DSM 44395]BBZ62983.1 hypothetical protein MMON_42840 [Mycolicibacterium monacense]